MDPEHIYDAFATANLWRPSTFFNESPSVSTLFTAPDLLVIKLEHPYISETVTEDDLKLPDLETFRYGQLSDPSLPEGSVLSYDSEPRLPNDEEEEDIWGVASEIGALENGVKHYAWETFHNTDHEEPCSAYISEAGPKTFNAVRQSEEKGALANQNVIQPDQFLMSLFALGLGRSSILFTYDNKRGNFIHTFNNSTMTGYSREASQSLVADIMACGRLVRHLTDFVAKTYASGNAFPAKVALANAVDTTLSAMEAYLSEYSTHTRSFLQLQQAFERPRRVISEVDHLVNSMKTARSNEGMATLMFQRCQHCEQESDWLRSVLLQFLARVSRPWLDQAEQWVGFQDEQGHNFGQDKEAFTFVSRESSDITTGTELDYVYRPESMPAFMSPEDGQTMFEIGRSLRILRAHHPEHPLSYARRPVQAPSLSWAFGWRDTEAVLKKAKSYERSLAVATRNYELFQTKPPHAESSLPPSESSEGQQEASNASLEVFTFHGLEMFDCLPSAKQSLPNDLWNILLTSAVADSSAYIPDAVDFSPPIALTPVLSFNPLLASQSRLVNAASIRLLLRSHHLRTHLDLQRSFQLLGHGVFVSRLTAALFDPSLSTTERQLGVVRSGSGMGLRLGSRGTWPPASSELRLALMGILNDCYQDDYAHRSHNIILKTAERPGSLSFAIRHLDEKQAEKILDPDSLHALDFLRLQYAAPPPLGTVLTPLALDRYDEIFKFLLRLSRLLFVVSHLPNDFSDQRLRFFRLQVNHFITTCSSYFFDSGVRETWDLFVMYLDEIERQLKEEDEAEECGTRVTEGVDDLRKHHEICLDRMTFALLLRHRQRKIMALLEEIFGLILDFAKECNHNAVVNPQKISQLQERFQIKTVLFLDVCKGMIGKRGYEEQGGGARGGYGKGVVGEENMIERLVLALDYGGYYARLA